MIIKPDSEIFGLNSEKFKILEFIGEGGFGGVFKIQNVKDKNLYALKTLPSDYPTDSQLQSLINEGKLAAAISHKNVITYNFFHDGNLYSQFPPYIIMEYASQGNLKGLIDQQIISKKNIDNKSLVNYFNQLIDGIEAINSTLIHRDIKPENILINDNLLKISDFGLSKVIDQSTRSMTFKGYGTVKYFSPEAWANAKNSIQMDIYAMGLVFYELATLHFPLTADPISDLQKWREAHLFQTPKNPQSFNSDLSATTLHVIQKMTEKDTKNRFKNWAEIREELKKERLPISAHAAQIESIIKKQLEKDLKENELLLQQRRRAAEIKEIQTVVEFQFHENILKPLEDFINDFNSRSTKKMELVTRMIPYKSQIIVKYPSCTFTLSCTALWDEICYKTIFVDDYGDGRQRKILDRPKYKSRNIMGWGSCESSSHKGFNWILVEKPEKELYGDWFILINKNSGFGSSHRIEPFAFSDTEFDEEIKNISSTHVYSTQHEPFRIDQLIKFIEESI